MQAPSATRQCSRRKEMAARVLACTQTQKQLQMQHPLCDHTLGSGPGDQQHAKHPSGGLV
eukprot:6214317-Pleurochrysis_carterae.AAC.2